MQIWKKRLYDRPGKQDGTRVFVDRTWPRDVKRSEADVDVWLRDLAPSRELREWYDHDPAKWGRFKRNYFRELSKFKIDEVDRLSGLAAKGRVTLLTRTNHTGERTYVAALKEYLEENANF